jgi:hypothetical protein
MEFLETWKKIRSETSLKNPNPNCRHIPTFVTFYKIIVLEIPQAANMGTTIVRMGDGQQGRWRWTTMVCIIQDLRTPEIMQ